MISMAKTLAVSAGLSAIAAPATIAHFNGWTAFENASSAPTVPEQAKTDQAKNRCAALNSAECAKERALSQRFDPEAAIILKPGAILDRDSPRFTRYQGSPVEHPPKGEVYVIWDSHLVRIVETSRRITKVYFNAL